MLLTKKFTFEMAHALDGYNGKCANVHGHSYHLEATVEVSVDTANNGEDNSGMVIDFHTIKDIVHRSVIDRFDHALVLKAGSPCATAAVSFPNLVEIPCNPTTENLLLHFASLITSELPAGTRLHSLRLAETDTSVAELLL